MYFAIKITALGGFDGSTPLIADENNPLKPGKNGVSSISVPATAGIIDPDVFGTHGANRNLLLQSYFLKFGGGGSQNVRIAVVDDDDTPAFEVHPEAGVSSPVFSDRRWVVPLGCRILVLATAGSPTLRLNFWMLDSPEQLGGVTPLFGP